MKTIGKDVILTLFIAGLFISNIVSLLGSSTRTFTFSPREEYLRLAEEAYRWMMQFQITPPGTPWGWHLNCSEAWGGLAGYYTRKYRWAALYGAESFYQLYIASHDVGWFIELGVELYKITRKNEYLKAAELAAQWAMRIQVGYSKWLDEFKSFYIAPRKVGRSVSWRYIPGVNFPREAAGAYTEGMFVFSGKPPFMDDWGVGEEFAEPALWIAPEHVTPIAQGLLKLYEVTHNKTYLTSALRAIDFVIRMQSPEGGIYTSYPPYAYGIRMGDTADAALLLFYAYKVTGNKTYLERALLACDFMLSKQVARGKRKGALPHLSSAGGEWRVNSFFTGDAAATISAWLEAYEITGDEKYLNAAFNAGTFVISMQEVGNEPLWGARLYAYDKRAIGGFYWVYSPGYGYIAYQFIGTTTSAAIALLKLYTKTRFSLFLSHVKLALRWLRETEIYSPLGRELELPGLVVYSDPHGLYKSGYVPKYGKYYDEIPGTMSGDPEQGFCVAMAAAGPCYLYLELYRLYSEIEGG